MCIRIYIYVVISSYTYQDYQCVACHPPVSKDLEAYSQQMQRLMTADKDMLAAIKDSEQHPTDVAKVSHGGDDEGNSCFKKYV